MFYLNDIFQLLEEIKYTGRVMLTCNHVKGGDFILGIVNREDIKTRFPQYCHLEVDNWYVLDGDDVKGDIFVCHLNVLYH